MKTHEFFLTVLVFAVFYLSVSFIGDFTITEEHRQSLFEKQEPIKCEKPCCHIFFNKYCEDCRTFNNNY